MEPYTTEELTRHADDLMVQLMNLAATYATIVQPITSLDDLSEKLLTEQAALIVRILDVVRDFGQTMIELKRSVA